MLLLEFLLKERIFSVMKEISEVNKDKMNIDKLV